MFGPRPTSTRRTITFHYFIHLWTRDYNLVYSLTYTSLISSHIDYEILPLIPHKPSEINLETFNPNPKTRSTRGRKRTQSRTLKLFDLSNPKHKIPLYIMRTKWSQPLDKKPQQLSSKRQCTCRLITTSLINITWVEQVWASVKDLGHRETNDLGLSVINPIHNCQLLNSYKKKEKK